MDVTMFLAQIWGPMILAVGLGIYVSRKYYMRLYHELEKETLAVLLFGMVAMAAGIAQIRFHNSWETFPQIVISLLGWLLLLKGLAFAIAPGVVDKSGDFQADSKLVPVGGAVMIILGIYLSWLGYFA